MAERIYSVFSVFFSPHCCSVWKIVVEFVVFYQILFEKM